MENQPGSTKLAVDPVVTNNPEIKGFSLKNFRIQSLFLALIVLVFYANTFSHEAAFDDRMAITDNEYVQSGFAGIPDLFTKDAYQSYLEHRQGSNQLAGGRYRPLSLITFALEQQMMGVSHDNETANEKEVRIAHEMHGRHVVNVLLYMLAITALLYFLRTIIFPDNPLAAFIAAILFTIHPLHTEVVANVKSRDEILSLLFISLTFIKALQYYDHKRRRDMVMALICFFLALLSKEYAVTLMALLPMLFYVARKETLTGSLKHLIPFFIPFALYLLLRFSSVSAMAEGAASNVMNNPYLLATGLQQCASEILVLFRYILLLVFPAVLSSDYSYNQLPYTSFANPYVWLSLLIYIGMIIVMCRLFLKRNMLSFAIGYFLANLFLVSNILINIGAPMGERLIFHSSVGFAIVSAWLLINVCKRLKPAAYANFGIGAVMIILIALSGYKTVERNMDWKNDETLFMTDVKTVPNSALVNNNAAAACMASAKKNKEDIPVRNEWFSKAIVYFSKAIAIYPAHTLSYINRGLCYYNMGVPDKALDDWLVVAKQEPNQENIQKYLTIAGSYFLSLGMKYSSANKVDSAIYSFKRSAEATPKSPAVWCELGTAYITAGNYFEARKAVDKALQLAPGYENARKLNDRLAKTSGPG